MSKNEKLLKEFIKYCKKNPSERFWQALRNWSGVAEIHALRRNDIPDNFEDTFYWENKYE